MTVHACRDLQLGPYSSGSYDTMWAVNAFMQGVVGYVFTSSAGNIPPPPYNDLVVTYPGPSSSIVSIHSASCLVTSSAGAPCLVFSQQAFNLSTFTQLSLDGTNFTTPVGLWVAVRSNNFPLANSGLFLVTSMSISANTLFIDYRSTSQPPAETTQYLTCSFWQPPPGSDTTGPSRTSATWGAFLPMITSNGVVASYFSRGASPQARVLLKSPHPSGYQVRLCIENPSDQQYGQGGGYGITPSLTIVPGFSGSAGDFPSQSYVSPRSQPHLHALQWFNNYTLGATNTELRGGTLVGHDLVNIASFGSYPGGYQVLHRFFAWGDDQTGACVIITRGHAFVNNPGTAPGSHISFVPAVMTAFGIPEDETMPLPANDVCRLFVVGQNNNANLDRLTWDCGTYNSNGVAGVAYSLDMTKGPISCVMSSYTYAGNSNGGGSPPIFDSAAGNTPFLGVIAGTYGSDWYAQPSNYSDGLNVEPRRLGRFPIARQGYSTGQVTWSTVDPAMSWFHTLLGVYLPWGGIASL